MSDSMKGACSWSYLSPAVALLAFMDSDCSSGWGTPASIEFTIEIDTLL